MALKAGIPSDLADSMAEAIQTAFTNNYQEVMGSEPPPPSKQMELLCVAVAQGVITHLKAHPEAFKVNVTDNDGDHYDGTVVEIL